MRGLLAVQYGLKPTLGCIASNRPLSFGMKADARSKMARITAVSCLVVGGRSIKMRLLLHENVDRWKWST